MICPHCQTINRDSCEHCFTCGFTFSDPTENAQFANLPEVVNEKSTTSPVSTIPPPLNTLPPPPDTAADEDNEDSEVIKNKTIANRYEIIEKLGQGGFAIVYRGRDLNLEREVAIKRILTKKIDQSLMDEILQRFALEAKAIAKLKHRNIVQVYDYDQDKDGYYIIMEYIDGGSLSNYVKSVTKLPPKEAIELVKGVAQGLYFAHRNNLIHRDIKPDNIMLGMEDGKPVPKIVDFGLARSGHDSDLSITGYAMGTPDYMAPEQRRDAKNVDHRADIYSLGKVLYKLLTGERPSDIIPTCIPPPATLSEIIFKCVNPKVEERYFSMDALINDFDNIDFSGMQKRDPHLLLLKNICPNCNAPNAQEDKFCAQCGDGLTLNCPECDNENSIQRPFCTGCGTDIKAFKQAEEMLQQITELEKDMRWGRIVKEFAILPTQFQFAKPKGKALLNNIIVVHKHAEEVLNTRDDLRTQLKSAIARNQYRDALDIIEKYNRISPDDNTIVGMVDKIKFRLFEVEFQAGLDDVRALRLDKKIRTVRSILNNLKKLKEDFQLPDLTTWSKKWQDNFELLESWDQEIALDEEKIKLVEHKALRSYEEQQYDLCITHCNEVACLSTELSATIELRKKAQQMMNEIDNKLELAQRYAASQRWQLVMQICEAIIKLQHFNPQARAWHEQAITRLQRKTNLQKILFRGMIVMLLGGAIIVGWNYKIQRDIKRKLAVVDLNQQLLKISQLVSEAKEKLAHDHKQSLSALNLANEAIIQSTNPSISDWAQPQQIIDLNTFRTETKSLQHRISLAQERFQKTWQNIHQLQEKINQLDQQEYKQAHNLLFQALSEIVDLRTQAGNSIFLEEEQQKKLADLEDMVGTQLLKKSLLMISTARSQALEANCSEMIPFKEADILTQQTQQASSNKAYEDVANLAIKAADLFSRCIILVPYADQLDKIRNQLNSHIGKIDIHLIEKYRPNLFISLIKGREAGENAVKIYDYPNAITHYEVALKSLEMAIDQTTASMIADGAMSPLQLQIINEFIKQIESQYYSIKIKSEITRFFPDRLVEIEKTLAVAGQMTQEGQFIAATERYEMLIPLLQETQELILQVNRSLERFPERLRQARELLVKIENGTDHKQRLLWCDEIMNLWSDINLEYVEKFSDADLREEYKQILSLIKKVHSDPGAIYERELKEVNRYLEAAKVDLIKQISPQGNVLVAFNFLAQAQAKGMTIETARFYKWKAYEFQIKHFLNQFPRDPIAIAKSIRGWLYKILKDLDVSISDVEEKMTVKELRAHILPLGLTPSASTGNHVVHPDQKYWQRLYPVRVLNSMNTEFCLVPPGKFIMGDEHSKFENEKPAHTVTLDTPFYLGKFEVLVGDVREFAQKNLGMTLFEDNEIPISGLTYTQAIRYCNWLNRKYQLPPSYRCLNSDDKSDIPADWELIRGSPGYRLPTEAEWEYACKYETINSSNMVKTTIWAGESIHNIVLSCKPSVLHDNNVYPNSIGLYLMYGNLEEWVSDWYHAYENQPVLNPYGMSETINQGRLLVRGGNRNSPIEEVSATFRKRLLPEETVLDSVGFRLLIPLPYELPDGH